MPTLDPRGPAIAMHGMAASEHPLVTQTGIDVMRRGGNAFDAALAMSAVLPVVKPGRSHLGGDAYILCYSMREARITAICSGGKAPAAATLDAYVGGIPRHGGAAVAIPGLIDAWQVMSDRFCSMPLADVLAPAISYARDGFPVSRELDLLLHGSARLFAKYTTLSDYLCPEGAPPTTGSVLRQPALAGVLDRVAASGRAGFYEGEMAERIAAGVRAAGGHMTGDDLRTHSADVLEPLSVDYRGATVYETPPNSQGLILLEELKIIEGFDMPGFGHLSGDSMHAMIEAKKLAFEDRHAHAGDIAFTGFDPASLLTIEHAAARRALVDPDRARPSTLPVASTDTTSFVVADGDGNLCSFIQSLYAPFGAALAIDGVLMNNRMTGFSLDPSSPNVLAPGKRTMHTLNTYMVFRDGRPCMIGNTPGADFQVQTNLQVITGALDYGLDPQAAIDAPRWGDTPAGLLVEDDMPAVARRDLARRGHDVRPVPKAAAPMGRAQAIVIDADSGAYIGGSDMRGDGLAAGW